MSTTSRSPTRCTSPATRRSGRSQAASPRARRRATCPARAPRGGAGHGDDHRDRHRGHARHAAGPRREPRHREGPRRGEALAGRRRRPRRDDVPGSVRRLRLEVTSGDAARSGVRGRAVLLRPRAPFEFGVSRTGPDRVGVRRRAEAAVSGRPGTSDATPLRPRSRLQGGSAQATCRASFQARPTQSGGSSAAAARGRAGCRRNGPQFLPTVRATRVTECVSCFRTAT